MGGPSSPRTLLSLGDTIRPMSQTGAYGGRDQFLDPAAFDEPGTDGTAVRDGLISATFLRGPHGSG